MFEGADDPNAPSQKSNHNRDPKQFAEARVDIRKFAQFLSGQQVNPLKVICSKYNIEKKYVGDYYSMSDPLIFNPLTAELFNLNFQ